VSDVYLFAGFVDDLWTISGRGVDDAIAQPSRGERSREWVCPRYCAWYLPVATHVFFLFLLSQPFTFCNALNDRFGANLVLGTTAPPRNNHVDYFSVSGFLHLHDNSPRVLINGGVIDGLSSISRRNSGPGRTHCESLTGLGAGCSWMWPHWCLCAWCRTCTLRHLTLPLLSL
jgi:hypothetical protein